MFVTAEAHAHVRFRRAIERRALCAAQDAGRELPNLALEDALELVPFYGECSSRRTRRLQNGGSTATWPKARRGSSA